MDNFKAVYRIGTIETHNSRRIGYYVCAVYADGKLSLQGVEGPTASGDCIGSCGQASDSLTCASLQPGEGWTRAKAKRLAAIWAEWHLSQMRPYDSAMKASGWHELAAKAALGYKFAMTIAAVMESRAAEAAALAALKAGEVFTPSAAQSKAAALPYSYVTWILEGEQEPSPLAGYERAKRISGADVESPDRRTLGWLKPSEHSEGLLGKVHPESGAAYGGKWYSEEVPESALAELAGFRQYEKPLGWFDWLGADVESAIKAAYPGATLGALERSEARRAWHSGVAAKAEGARLADMWQAGSGAARMYELGKESSNGAA